MFVQHSTYDLRAAKRISVNGFRVSGDARTPYLTWMSVHLWTDADGWMAAGFDINGTPEQLRDFANKLEAAVQDIEAIAAKQRAEAAETAEAV